jgi:outer membrane lipoprotein LolB
MHAPLRLLFTLLCLIIVVTGCSSTPTDATNQADTKVDTDLRSNLLAQLSEWKINGKIAFITAEERNSASLYWQKAPDQQKLNLTTYLGINVLQLNSNDGVHVIEVDGNEYSGTDLDYLISSITNLTLPTEALTFWIKALPYLPSDVMTLTPNNLPKTLTSIYNNRTWSINYSAYKPSNVNGFAVNLPYKIKVKSNDLTINIAIKKWTI